MTKNVVLIWIAGLLGVGTALGQTWTCDLSGPSTAAPGSTHSITLTATPSGDFHGTQSIMISTFSVSGRPPLSPGVSFTGVSTATSGLTCHNDSYSPDCDGTLTVTTGQTETVTAQLTIDPDLPPGTTITIDGTKYIDGKTIFDKQITITVGGGGPKLQLTKKALFKSNEDGSSDAMYTLTVTNVGSAPTSGPISVGDRVLRGVVTNPSSGCNLEQSNLLHCETVDSLLPGQFRQFSFAAHYAPVMSGSLERVITNTAEATGGGDLGLTVSNGTIMFAAGLPPRASSPMSSPPVATNHGRR